MSELVDHFTHCHCGLELFLIAMAALAALFVGCAGSRVVIEVHNKTQQSDTPKS